jgi:Ca2+-transporting ATPase
MKRPPRNPNDSFFGWSKITFSLFKGILLLGMVVTIYFISINEGHSNGEIRAITFSALIIGNVFLILSSLSKTRSFISVILEKNIAVIIISLVAFVMLMLTITIPFLQIIFAFEFPGFNHFASSLIGAMTMLFILEFIKHFKQSHWQNTSIFTYFRNK